MTPAYRPDIDGLRAIAVLSILFFHLGIDAFGGGYVGVDIFFVISGYLITSIIVREIASGDFSIAQFYERRARRILPALVVTLAATLLIGYLLLSPAQMRELAQSALATAFYVSNVFFFFSSGYFDGPAELKPLLHTWSLAVEEQYYILFPFLMLLIARKASRRYALVLVPLLLVSLIGCVLLTASNSSAAFYLIPTRAWQLFAGSVLALHLVTAPVNALPRNLLAAAGLAMMLVAILAFTPDTPFPGYAAALPTFGAALVIHANSGGTTLVGRFLSLKAMVFTGLVSYSLYLWHWPGVVYARYVMINELTDIEKGALFTVVFGLAVLSWRYVERPFRNRSFIASRTRLFAVSAAALVAVSGIGLGLAAAKTEPGVADGNTALANDPGWPHWKECEDDEERMFSEAGLCRLGFASGQAGFLFWGDSHVIALASAVNLSARRHGVSGVLATRTACPPLLGIERPGRSSCNAFNGAVLRYLDDHPDIRTVLLAARWPLSTKGTRYKNEDGRAVSLVDLHRPGAGKVDNVTAFETGLYRTISELSDRGLSIVLVGPVPEVGFDVPSSNYVARLTGRDTNERVAPAVDEYRQRTREVTSAFAEIGRQFALRVVAPSDILCGNIRCDVVLNGTPLYRDDNHLSVFGARHVSQVFDPAFAEMANKPR
ncbi:MAG: acyltransferase [Gammaproteobacteria bacterium]|nr:acyltransferase [Gammaproteobacteria bacterium]